MRKPTLSVSNQVRHKPVCTATGDSQKMLDLESIGGIVQGTE